MEPPLDPDPGPGPASDAFFDAPDQWPPPESEQAPDRSSSSSTVATTSLEHAGDAAGEGIEPAAHPTPQTPPAGLRRRRASSRSSTPRRNPNPADSKGPICNSRAFSEISNPRDRRSKAHLLFKDQVRGGGDPTTSGVGSDQAAAGDDDGRVEAPVAPDEGSSGDVELSTASTGASGPPPSSCLLVSIAGLVIKAIGFQMSLLASSVTFPLWLLYCSFLLVTDPFGTLKRGRDHIWQTLMWVCTVLRDRVGPLVIERFSTERGVGKWVLRVALGCFWSFYVCLMLLVCLVSAFLIGRLLMGSVVEEPLRFTEELSFDYTKASPVAVVPITTSNAVVDCGKNVGIRKWDGQRLIPPNHKLQLTVSLTLPESDYNRKLGVFQVKVEFLSSNGKIIASSSRPCMLWFKSQPIRFLETFFKSGPLLAGYSSESQILSLKVRGITEGSEPTACIRIILERRAEYRPGAGVPEIYAAYIKLESELPLLKKLIWNWRRTLFVWISMGLFISELLFILVCCAPLIIPRSRQINVSSAGHSS
uniref:Seipin n=1 Tax=Anthurium amnicola TaxID=1678845 RepID=A0A1D1ZHH9_9ARAE